MRPIGSNANSNLLPDFHGVHEIEQKEVLSNDKTSVEIANELTIDSQKKRKHSDSPDRIIRGPDSQKKIPGFIESRSMKTVGSSLGFNKIQARQANNRYAARNPRLHSAAASAQFGIMTKNTASQRVLQTQGKFYTRLSLQPSYDKVISYDTASLLADLPEKPQNENNNRLNVPKVKLNSRARPFTSKYAFSTSKKTINE